ncbi:MAG: DNA mismatch repair protein MutS, partial [Bacteroidales bacterium]|nr:DNA mismatch repair protein MutS [Bacteroidales bacterium]
MKSFKTCLQHISGLKFIYENLALQSPVGRKRLLQQTFITDAVLLQKELDMLEESVIFLQQENNYSTVKSVNLALQQVHDIANTVSRLGQKQVLDDIELFEIKKFCLLSQQIAELLSASRFQAVSLADLQQPVDILDPEQTRIPHFYIYAAYDATLDTLRKKITAASNPEEAEKYRMESMQCEDNIRAGLARQLFPFHRALAQNIEQIALLDMLWSKAEQALKLGFCKPVISTKNTSYKKLFNPAVKEILQTVSKDFQAIDIELYPDSCLITGANMSGKTVLLKSIALSQYLFQFGFYVPAASAAIVLVDEVAINIGDHQSEVSGLSSFANEILKIDQIIKKVKSGEKLLVLIDELARTTNPEEGKAIVSAFVQLMSKYGVTSVVTTHYSGILASVRKLRVKGLKIDRISEDVTPQTLNDYMDYSLVETQSNEAPMEA